MNQFWNERYSTRNYIYGKVPNQFFKQEIDKLKPGRLLLIGEGEGRNAVYAAKSGWKVDAYDFSEEAKKKAINLANENNVEINYIIQDLNYLNIPKDNYDAVGVIYIHLETDLRAAVHQKIIESLKTNGTLILEVFEKEQINYTSGGPKDLSLLYSLEDIVDDFHMLDFKSLCKEIITLDEGPNHYGEASVIRFTGEKSE